MGDYDDVPYIVIERRSGGGAAFLWGLLLGAGAALLLAPRSGAETQEEIRERARRLRQAAEDRVGDARDTVSGAVSRTRNRMYDQLDSVKEALEARTQNVRDALDAGRRAAGDARSELQRRVARAKADLGDSDRADAAAPPSDTEVIITDVVIEEGGPELG